MAMGLLLAPRAVSRTCERPSTVIGLNALNILLDAALFFVIGPNPAMGVAGAAAASSMSQWIVR